MNTFQKRIKLYKSLLNDKRNKGLEDLYKKYLKESERILKLLKENKMTPCQFNKLTDRLKWDVYPLLKNVTWKCAYCGEIDDNVRRSQPFFGALICCGNCSNELTCRTGGGQNDHFNWTFKRNK